MADPENDAQALQTLAPFRGKQRKLVARKTQPVHPRVDMDRGFENGAGLARRRRPAGDLGQRVQHRREAVLDERRHSVGRGAVQYENSGIGHDRAQGDALVQPRHEVGVAAGRRQRAGDGRGAGAVGVGLDHAGDGRRSDQALAEAIIRHDRVQPHGQARRLEIRSVHGPDNAGGAVRRQRRPRRRQSATARRPSPGHDWGGFCSGKARSPGADRAVRSAIHGVRYRRP